MICLTGKVVKGKALGRVLGFPTANIDRRDYSRRKLKIKHGIYAGGVEWKNSKNRTKVYPAGIVVGPNDSKGLPNLEAHLIGFKGDLYSQTLEICLQKYLRPFKKFKSEEKLKKQIQIDIKQIQKIIK